MSRRVRKAQRRLRICGWRITVDGIMGSQTRATIKKFQRGFLGPRGARGWRKPLDESGRLDRKTRRALKWSAKRGGRCSDHFFFGEFRSKGNGDIIIDQGLVRVLERLRATKSRALPIISGYRDPYHNSNVGGARFSQHVYGNAADLSESLRITVAEARDAGASGIGYDADNGFVQHVDVRHLGPNNTTGASAGNPTTWQYG